MARRRLSRGLPLAPRVWRASLPVFGPGSKINSSMAGPDWDWRNTTRRMVPGLYSNPMK